VRITQIVATPVSLPFRRPERWSFGEHREITSVVLEMHTDSGVVGLGEAVPGGPGPRTLLAAIEELAPLLEGRDPTQIEANVRRLYYAGGWYFFQRTGNLIIAGLEMAMWDILGKTLELPVHKLFGGRLRDRVDFMYYLQRRDEDVRAHCDEAVDAVNRGFQTIYIKVGDNEAADIELVAGLREAVGPHVRLRVDANEAWTVGTAVRMLRRLEPYDLEFVEQPVRMDDLDALMRLRGVARVPIAANQSAWTGQRTLEIIKRQAADVIVTDPHQEGGLGPFRKVVGLCELAGLPVVFHAYSGLTINMSAALQVLCSSPNCMLAHQAYAPGDIQGDVTTKIFDISTGSAAVSDEPGLGVTLDGDKLQDAAKRYRAEGFYSLFDANLAPSWVPQH
jgi:L-alanine-DL-glutamate epimerase-like enolase superfamily enzyme